MLSLSLFCYLNNYISYFFIRPPPLMKCNHYFYYISKEILLWINTLILIGK